MDSRRKVVAVSTLKRHIRRYRAAGQTIAFTNGCFDILHFGHVRYLESAKKPGRLLIVGLNSDTSVKQIKGPHRPVNKQGARAAVLAALACVDYVTIFDEDTPERLIAVLQPDVLIKGADWREKTVAGASTVRRSGGRVEFIEYINDFSTTALIDAIRKK